MQGILPRNLPVSRINASNVMTKPHPLEHFRMSKDADGSQKFMVSVLDNVTTKIKLKPHN